ncbi:Coiled-coil domain-containing protein [Echinococcus granulosus]|uniref:Coiled-coil domain-containing protein n=1 Tax=Echinococcus granulosus TaxID=6210 RepID=W6UGH8_ECHGR|nr:Coiled-coil domain-containing protein [Echinococcus granulosus]EUB60610.1 Coiled-coil domain-containing protein [Echinococcus granulosus]
MGEEILLIAEPRDSLRGAFFEAKPEEIDIYLGEFASKALQGLDELLAKKEIRLLEALDLKRKCQHLVNLTKKTQKNALQLEDMFVRLTEAGKRISSALRRRNEFPDGFESEADNLRKQILRAYNDVMAADHNVESLTYQIAALEEEMKPLAKEAAKFPTAETLKSRRKEMEHAVDTEMIERKKYSLESRRLHRQLNDVSECRDQLANRLAECQKSVDSLTIEFNSVQSRPQEVMQEIIRLEGDLSALKDVLFKSEDEIKELTEMQSRLEQSKADVEAESIGLTTLSEKLSTAKHQCQELKDEEIQLNGAITKMKADLNHMAEEKRRYLESTNRVIKSGAVTRKLIRRGEKKMRHLEETIKYLEEMKKVQAADLELMKKAASKRDMKERKKLRTQISQMTGALLAQNDYAEHEKEEIRVLMKEATKLLAEIDAQKRGVTNLHRLVEAKSCETSQKKRYLRKTQLHYVQVKRDLKLQQFHLNDYRKTLLSLQRQLQNLGNLYKAISVERNECLTMINLAQQKKLTIEEKCYLYSNEVAILQSSLSNKRDQMDDVRRRMEGLRKESIVIRSDLSKQTQVNRELESHNKWFSTNLQRLNRDLDEEKTRISRLQDECKAAIQRRDCTKQQLENVQMKVKRTKESLEDLEKSGKKSRDALSAKNRELALLLHENLTEARTVEIVRSKVAEKGAVKEELIHINDQVSNQLEVTAMSFVYQTSAARDRLFHLEDLADNPPDDNSINRLRFLQGTDPSLEELSRGEKHLLSAVAKKETKLRENHAIFTIVDNLVAQLASKTNEESERSLELAKKANFSYRINYLKETEMKATCAELRMKILHSAVLKRSLEELKAKKPEDRQLLQRRSRRDPLLLLQNETDLNFYTTEVISQLSINSIKKFFV